MSHGTRCVAAVYFHVTGEETVIDTIDAFYPVHEHCVVTSQNAFQDMRDCKKTQWSSYYPDPKSEFPSYVESNYFE